jgi:hypothetical protein
VYGDNALGSNHPLWQSVEVVGNDFKPARTFVLAHEKILDGDAPAATEAGLLQTSLRMSEDSQGSMWQVVTEHLQRMTGIKPLTVQWRARLEYASTFEAELVAERAVFQTQGD